MRINSFVTPESLSEDTVSLSPAESHHLARVLRAEPGQELTLFDGQGTRAEGIVETVAKKEVTVRITERETIPPPEVDITLFQAVCKPDRFKMILQKATELGVRTIQPIITQNASLPAGKTDKMIGRGEAIIRNAAQQCGTAWLPSFQPLEKLPAIFPTLGKTRPPDCRAGTVEKRNLSAVHGESARRTAAGRSATLPALQKFDAVFVGSLHPNAVPFKKAIEQLRNNGSAGGLALPENTAPIGGAGSSGEPFRAALLIGPEGDFTEKEMDAAVEAGAIPVTFGKQILRTETAAIFGLSVLAYELN